MQENETLVSVISIVFNQKDYVEQCLESLVSQETTFPYKVIVHDDCSTDGTTDIVKRFAAEHADKVVLLLETENQYSQGADFCKLLKPYIRGKYIAECEGDDWWIDPHKLQKQFDYMESHPEVAACSHAAKRYIDSRQCFGRDLLPASKKRAFSTDDMIAMGNQIPTNSFFYRSEFYVLPDVYRGWGVGDYPSSIYLSTCGVFHYDPAIMSAYRVGARGSWSSRMSSSIEANVQSLRKRIDGLEAFDRYTEGRYHESVANAVEDRNISIAVLRRNFSAVKSNARFRSYSLKKRMTLWLRCINPKLASHLQKRRLLHKK